MSLSWTDSFQSHLFLSPIPFPLFLPLPYISNKGETKKQNSIGKGKGKRGKIQYTERGEDENKGDLGYASSACSSAYYHCLLISLIHFLYLLSIFIFFKSLLLSLHIAVNGRSSSIPFKCTPFKQVHLRLPFLCLFCLAYHFLSN